MTERPPTLSTRYEIRIQHPVVTPGEKGPFFRPTHGQPMTAKRRKYLGLIGRRFTIEGNIGIGKTTLVQSLVRYLNQLDIRARGYPEIYDPDHLRLFIQGFGVPGETSSIKDRCNDGTAEGASAPLTKIHNPNAFSFQLDQLMNRKLVGAHSAQLAAEGWICFEDRSLIGDYVFAKLQYDDGNITPAEMQIYMKRQGQPLPLWGPENLYEPYATIFLKCSPEKVCRRVRQRGRENEDQYSIEYFRKLSQAYEDALQLFTHPIITMEWGEDSLVSSDGFLPDRVCEEVLDAILSIPVLIGS